MNYEKRTIEDYDDAVKAIIKGFDVLYVIDKNKVSLLEAAFEIVNRLVNMKVVDRIHLDTLANFPAAYGNLHLELCGAKLIATDHAGVNFVGSLQAHFCNLDLTDTPNAHMVAKPLHEKAKASNRQQ